MTALQGTIAITDYGWYRQLLASPELEEVNFWKPSALRASHAPKYSPFLFKLRAPDNAICGFGYFVSYSRLPDWYAWETFNVGNGCATFEEMRDRISKIRERIRFKGPPGATEIGCILIVQPIFFPDRLWVAEPRDWPKRTQTDKRYDLSVGEGARVWQGCLDAAAEFRGPQPSEAIVGVADQRSLRYGPPVLVKPRLGQGTFRVAVTEAYSRACAITGEHSLPALEAAHIRPYKHDGPHEINNGLLVRADFHRLLDLGYIAISEDLRLEVGRRLRQDFENGRSYYPYHGQHLHLPDAPRDRPAREYLEWHRSHRYLG